MNIIIFFSIFFEKMIRLDLVWEIVKYTASLFDRFMRIIFDFVVQYFLAIKKNYKTDTAS